MYSKLFIVRLACLISLFVMTATHVADAQDKITGPWLWMIVPTEPNRGGAYSTDVDSLAIASGGAVTEAYVAANGANEGDAVGDLVWTLGEIADTGYDNVNDLVNELGFAESLVNDLVNDRLNELGLDVGDLNELGLDKGAVNDLLGELGLDEGAVNDLLGGLGLDEGAVNVDHHSSYALITLESVTDQHVPMLVGSDDSIKVWLNGEVVYKNPVNRGSSSFQDIFFVDLVAGDNLLLVKVSERSGEWSMFVGIAADVNAVYKPSSAFLSISPFPVVSPAVGEQFVVSVDIADGKNLAGYQLTLAFDTTALRYVASLQTTGYLPTGALIINPRVSGNNVTLLATSLSGVSQGDGTLAHVTFEVVAYKPSMLVLDAVKLVDSQGNALPVSIENGEVVLLLGDVNGNGVVNIQDLVLVANSFGKTGKTSADVNGDGVVDITDLVVVAGDFQAGAAAPSMHAQSLGWFPSAADIRQWLSQAHQFDLDDARYQRGILVLEHLLAVLMPQETVLLPNYPNPFNPETWIPYQLAAPANVVVQIYAVDGVLVRTLALGHQPAGSYQNKSHAAYWDGKNEQGESVASGVYFYTLKAGDFSATKKMLIRK